MSLDWGFSNIPLYSFISGVLLTTFSFNSVQLLSCVRLFATPWTATCQASISITKCQSLLKFMSIELLMPSNHLILCLAFNLSLHQGLFWVSSSPGGQSIGASASASVLPMNIKGSFLLGLTGLISLQSKGISRVFSNTIVQKHQFFSAQLSLWSNSHIHAWLLEKP